MRNSILAVAAGLLLCALPGRAQLVTQGDKFFGGILQGRAGRLKAPPVTFDTYFNKVTSENAGKWGNVEVDRDVYDWTALDAQYAYAQARGMPFTLHTLLWSEKEPAWLQGLSPAAVRAEVEEWIRDCAARYPDVHSIDVVNEAPHGKTGSQVVVDAFGGPGATGYDHVVAVYALARQYFPSALFILNDYDVLKRANYAAYDQCAAALLAAGVLDALGCQAHFLENTTPARLRQRLDYLSSTTGLPIYITELELALANDQQQLAKYQELFPVMWEHPAVRGVTLWGYEDMKMWRDDGYLLRADGTERPALQWLRSYLAPAPPPPTQAPVRLEAEDHDEQHGVRTWSQAIGYCDNGDWIKFEDVDFADVQQLRLRFARGNRQAARVELRLDDRNAPPAGTFATYRTGGWNAYVVDSVDIAPAVTGLHDVYLRFYGGSGIGNFDYFELVSGGSAPPPPTTSTIRILAAGRTGTERMRLQIAGNTVATWTNVGGDAGARQFVGFDYTHPSVVTADQVRVRFDNDDGQQRDLRVDGVLLDGQTYQAEAADTYSVGTWTSGTGCAGGFKQREWLHCNGFFAFAQSAQPLVLARPDRLELSAAPNPVGQVLTVQWEALQPAHLQVADATGRVVFAARDLVGGEFLLDVAGWTPGPYALALQAGGAREVRLVSVLE